MESSFKYLSIGSIWQLCYSACTGAWPTWRQEQNCCRNQRKGLSPESTQICQVFLITGISSFSSFYVSLEYSTEVLPFFFFFLVLLKSTHAHLLKHKNHLSPQFEMNLGNLVRPCLKTDAHNIAFVFEKSEV
jgi:hypothetical protein